jgi:hypothetical protein
MAALAAWLKDKAGSVPASPGGSKYPRWCADTTAGRDPAALTAVVNAHLDAFTEGILAPPQPACPAWRAKPGCRYPQNPTTAGRVGPVLAAVDDRFSTRHAGRGFVSPASLSETICGSLCGCPVGLTCGDQASLPAWWEQPAAHRCPAGSEQGGEADHGR